MSASQVAAFIKMKLEQRSTSLMGAFRKADKSNTGFISPDDFEALLRDFNIRLTRQLLAALVAKYDVNQDGYVSYEEFATVMTGAEPTAEMKKRPPVADPAGNLVKAEDTFRRILYQEQVTLTQAFLKIDRNRSGFCNPSELATIFAKANVSLSTEELAAIVKTYDKDGNGKIDIRELSKLLHTKGAPFEPPTARGQKRARV